MKLIPLDAVLAEIARQKAQWRICKSSEAKYRREMLDDISSFFDTLEVKEVDLEKEWKEFLKDGDVGFKEIANHFFKLGLKAQKGEKV